MIFPPLKRTYLTRAWDVVRDEELHMASGMIAEPPSATKLALIRRFLVANGTQAEIDSGSFLQRFAFPGSPLAVLAATSSRDITSRETFEMPMKALLKAY
jgi:hypothetical protein